MMTNKAILILADGMRPDALEACGNPYAMELYRASAHTMTARTVMPSVTLPCHMSLFHSVTPQRHGILSNTYVPQVRPVSGICEVLNRADRTCAIYTNWNELRDLCPPASLEEYVFFGGLRTGYDAANHGVTDAAIRGIRRFAPDFLFVYLGYPDVMGHAHGWMSPEYLDSVAQCFDCIHEMIDMLPKEYTAFITADHGGHDRIHGTELPEDMCIPLLIHNARLAPEAIAEASILDIAPTITQLLGVTPDKEWEGRVLPLHYNM